MTSKEITITKARVHNLKEVSTKIPKNTLTVITGPSGSGKSSLAFDTIYVEGQRRYIESLSSYARQFLGQHQPPDVESIEGLSPAIAIDQKSTSKNPRSTVGTITEVYDYLRILYARVGTLYCPETGTEVRKYTVGQIVAELIKHPLKTKIQLLAPISLADNPQGEVKALTQMGFPRVRFNKKIIPLEELPPRPEKTDHLEIVVDRILLKKGVEKRIADSVEHALRLGKGDLSVLIGEQKKETTFSQHNKALGGKILYPDLEPRLFSFNSPLGACDLCNGIGQSKTFDEKVIIQDVSLPIFEGAIGPLTSSNYLGQMVSSMAKVEKVDLNRPYKKLPKKFRTLLFQGSSKKYHFSLSNDYSSWKITRSFPGIVQWLQEKYLSTSSERTRRALENWMRIQTCPSCGGNRLNSLALATEVAGKNIMELSSLTIEKLFLFVENITLTGEKKIISEKILKEIKNRLSFLINVGLEYLSLNRPAMTLSGGESQRIRLATQIGSALSGVLYVLDEPSIGLHQRDNSKLIKTLKSLRDMGNTLLVVEHDEETMLEADYIIDMGPGAGAKGGKIVLQGKTKAFICGKNSTTAQYLSGKKSLPVPTQRRRPRHTIKLVGATQNNLKNLDVDIPLGIFVAITGVSGSGKSTLMHEVFVPVCCHHLAPQYYDGFDLKGKYSAIKGIEQVDSIIELDQSPIGRTPKSNPATYTKVLNEIRLLYSQTPESRARGHRPGRFSFNVKGGRCEECEGNGVKSIEMHFLADVYITCKECKGKRYNRETLSIFYRGKNIADILDLSISEAKDFFQNHSKIYRILDVLDSVGLGYMKLGQPATTLSGGEAQRLKLGRELGRKARGHCLYVLDEPTTGLHFEDLKILLNALERLVTRGHSVLVIEHNLDVIKFADHIIDLGPEGGEKGGKVIACGTPEEVAQVKASHTGQYLKKMLGKGKK